MDKQIILAVDEQGNFAGEYIPKEAGHTGQGKRHLAITVLVYNDKDEVLLQNRKHKIFDNIWDFTGATHPLHAAEKDETIEEATWRCLDVEYNIQEKIPLKNYGFFNYFAEYQDGLCEHEHCAMMVGEYNDDFNLNSETGYGYKWMDKNEFLRDILANPKNYSPWSVAGVALLENGGFFDRI